MKFISGVKSARNLKVIQPADASKQRTLPRYDFPNRMVNVTPGVNRIMKLKVQDVEGKEKIKIEQDNTMVFNRPKYFVGSSLGFRVHETESVRAIVIFG